MPFRYIWLGWSRYPAPPFRTPYGGVSQGPPTVFLENPTACNAPLNFPRWHRDVNAVMCRQCRLPHILKDARSHKVSLSGLQSHGLHTPCVRFDVRGYPAAMRIYSVSGCCNVAGRGSRGPARVPMKSFQDLFNLFPISQASPVHSSLTPSLSGWSGHHVYGNSNPFSQCSFPNWSMIATSALNGLPFSHIGG